MQSVWIKSPKAHNVTSSGAEGINKSVELTVSYTNSLMDASCDLMSGEAKRKRGLKNRRVKGAAGSNE